MKLLRDIVSRKYTLTFFLVAIFVWFAIWALQIATAPGSSLGGPDQGLRYLVPQFIYEHGTLPTGYDAATIHSMGNWSYAFYPQFLGPIISAIFMWAVSLFNSDPDVLVYAARMTSVLFGVVAVYFVGKSVEKLFSGSHDAKVASFVAMALFAAWPQVAFLSGYVNNDIIALAGVSIVVFACISGYKDRWNGRNTSILALGFVVCLLSYINSYGFVLFAGIFFVLSLYWQVGFGRIYFRLFGISALIVVLLAGPFFARNAVIYQGDVLGMASFRERTLEWEQKSGVEAQKSYTELEDAGLERLVSDKGYTETQLGSAIARFGKMSIAPADKYLSVYRAFILIGMAGCALAIFQLGIRHLRGKRRVRRLRMAIFQSKQMLLLGVCLLAACTTTVGLSVYYTLVIDYQPQGRYIIYLLVPLMICAIMGIYYLLSEVIAKKYRLPLALTGVVIYLATSVYTYYKYILTVESWIVL